MYHNVYYRFYKFIQSLGEESIPRYNAVMLMCIFHILNLTTLLCVLSILARKVLIVDRPVILGILGATLILADIYAIFGMKRYIHIEAKFERESNRERNKGKFLAFIYMILTVALLVGVLTYLDYYPITNTGMQGTQQ